MKYPTLPVDLLDDGCIEPGDYPDWPTARHEIKHFPDDRRILNELLASISEEGLLEPLILRVRRRSRHVLLSEGHHRAVALMELGIKQFTYRWHWCGPYDGIKYRSTPLPQHITEYLELSRA